MSLNRILYIEDDPGEAEIFPRFYNLVRHKFHGDCEIHIARSWEEGCELVNKINPQVIIADLSLPPTLNSDETLEEISKKAKYWPPIVVLTGNSYDLNLRRRSIKAGADDFIIKEIRREGFYENIVERVYHAHLRREYRDAPRA